MVARSIAMHAGLLVISAGLAVNAWLKEDAPEEAHEAQLWGGESEQIQRIEFDADKRKLTLEAKQDEAGRYWIGDVDKVKSSPASEDPHSPHSEDKEPAKDEGPQEREQVRFIGVTEVNELAAGLMPLRAKRSLGVLPDERLEEFGFDKEHPATLKVHFSGGVHELLVGGKTPGGSDTYVRQPDGAAFVLGGNLSGDLNSAESRLVQRGLHSWEEDEAGKAVVISGESSRELTRLEGKRSNWAVEADPTKKDETATNWMSKFERLRISHYDEKPAPDPQVFVKVQYADAKGKAIGFVELAAVTPAGQDKPVYYARSELSRWWGSVVSATAEQLKQDLPILVGE